MYSTNLMKAKTLGSCSSSIPSSVRRPRTTSANADTESRTSVATWKTDPPGWPSSRLESDMPHATPETHCLGPGPPQAKRH